jgi:uncharacterized membrane protein YraQ (UPF0718 family)
VETILSEKSVFEFVTTFISILYEALPFIVLGAVIAGLLEELVPQSLVARIIPRSRVLAIGIGGFLGLLFPMCECGIIPVMRRMLRKGVPLSSCVCYMLAGPIINVVVMLSTYVAFSGTQTTVAAPKPTASPASLSAVESPASTPAPATTGSQKVEAPDVSVASRQQPAQIGAIGMTALRMLLGYLVAFGTGLIVETQYRKHGNKLLTPLATPSGLPLVDDNDNGLAGPPRSWMQRLGNISETALHDFVDITVFLILGAFLAALSRLFLSHEHMQSLALDYPGLAILIFMGLAILLCICSEADAFIAASFRLVPPVPKLAFLVLGPMLDLKLYMMYTRVFRPRLIWTIIVSVVVQVLLYSLLVNFLWNNYGHLLVKQAAG